MLLCHCLEWLENALYGICDVHQYGVCACNEQQVNERMSGPLDVSIET